jgi:hypothetical protein
VLLGGLTLVIGPLGILYGVMLGTVVFIEGSLVIKGVLDVEDVVYILFLYSRLGVELISNWSCYQALLIILVRGHIRQHDILAFVPAHCCESLPVLNVVIKLVRIR